MTADTYQKLEKRFAFHAVSHWAHLSRINNLLIILNISMFFLTDLVIRQGYYYTYYSLLFLIFTALGPLIGIGLMNRLWYYFLFVMCEFAGSYFLIVSAWYWVKTNGG